MLVTCIVPQADHLRSKLAVADVGLAFLRYKKYAVTRFHHPTNWHKQIDDRRRYVKGELAASFIRVVIPDLSHDPEF